MHDSKNKEKGTKRGRKTVLDRETDTEKVRQRHDGETYREKNRDKETERQRQTKHRHETEIERETSRHREADRQTDRESDI